MLYLSISTIPGSGKGLFTDAPIKRSDIIVEYTGEIVTWKECLLRNEAGKGGYVFFISPRYCIDAYNHLDSLARYANDARGFQQLDGVKNNSRFEVRKKKVFLIASRNITPGEEIMVSYGRSYWKYMERK